MSKRYKKKEKAENWMPGKIDNILSYKRTGDLANTRTHVLYGNCRWSEMIYVFVTMSGIAIPHANWYSKVFILKSRFYTTYLLERVYEQHCTEMYSLKMTHPCIWLFCIEDSSIQTLFKTRD